MQFVEWANRAMRSSRAAKVTAKFRVCGRQHLPWDYFLLAR